MIHPDFATRVTKNSATIIDHIVSNLMGTEYESFVDETDLSDHKFIFTSLKFKSSSRTRKTETRIIVIDYNSLDKEIFWNNVNSIHSFDELIENLNDIVKRNRKVISLKPQTNKQPWVTAELIQLIRERTRFFKYKKKCCDDSYIQRKYKLLKKSVQEMNKKLKNEYFDTKLEENLVNPKKYWYFLKERSL